MAMDGERDVSRCRETYSGGVICGGFGGTAGGDDR